MVNNLDHEVYASFVKYEIFSPQEAAQILELCSRLEEERATTLGDSDNQELDKIRRSTVSWLPLRDNDFKWIYDRAIENIKKINDTHYGFLISGVETAQFATYSSQVKGTYDWHIDMCGRGDGSIRKLSMAIPLSSPTEYDGGSLLIQSSEGKIVTHSQNVGYGFVFPSWVSHSVTPVFAGKRHSLVFWFYGPKFT